MEKNSKNVQAYNVFVKGSNFEPQFSIEEQKRGVRYNVATYGSLKTNPMRPNIFGSNKRKRK